ncbi:hypothetical protein QJQ45_025939 [Haematococcus lacustris]|nr:hypothetical protein QJQ45_025939 [Haematococcus lacustris]
MGSVRQNLKFPQGVSQLSLVRADVNNLPQADQLRSDAAESLKLPKLSHDPIVAPRPWPCTADVSQPLEEQPMEQQRQGGGPWLHDAFEQQQ